MESLLRFMQNVVERHSETEVLENCAKTLEVLCTEEHAIYSRCDVIRSTMIDRLVNKLREVLDEHSNLLAGVSGQFSPYIFLFLIFVFVYSFITSCSISVVES